jgi:hypothetical protein
MPSNLFTVDRLAGYPLQRQATSQMVTCLRMPAATWAGTTTWFLTCSIANDQSPALTKAAVCDIHLLAPTVNDPA